MEIFSETSLRSQRDLPLIKILAFQLFNVIRSFVCLFVRLIIFCFRLKAGGGGPGERGREKRVREAGFPRWREPGEIEKHFAIFVKFCNRME